MFIFPYRDETPHFRFPYITLLLISLNSLLFMMTTGPGMLENLAPALGFTTRGAIERPYTLLTSIFLHANLLHLIANMWFLWLFGDNIEDRFGRLSFIGLYLSAGIIGSLTHSAFSLFQDRIPVIGASGAVAGVMGAYLIRFPYARLRCLFLIIFYPVLVRIRAVWVLGFWMFFEFLSAWFAAGDNVAHWAHVGGFATGIMWAVRQRKRYSIGYRWWE